MVDSIIQLSSVFFVQFLHVFSIEQNLIFFFQFFLARRWYSALFEPVLVCFMVQLLH